MKQLLLLRHAKAESSGKGGGRDHERALSGRGVRDAAEMGRAIAARWPRIDLVLCSSSTRTRQTWEGVAEGLKAIAEPRFLRDLYEAGDYLPIVRREGGDAECVLLIGHNPATQATATDLADSGTEGDAEALRSHFPTAALAAFELDGSWAELRPGGARLVAFLRPGEG